MKRFILFALFIMCTLAHSFVPDDELQDIMEVLKYVESNHDPQSVGDNGSSYGILQITRACVEDVNRHYGTHYRHEDMFQVECAEEVFLLYAKMGMDRYCDKYGREATEEVVVKNHNGGIYRGYRIKATDRYYRKYLDRKKLIHNM